MLTITVQGTAFAGQGTLFDFFPKKRTIRPLKNDPEGKRTDAVEVVGDSMTGDGIQNGDIIIYTKTPVASPGTLVVVETSEGVFVKRFYPAPNDMIRLVSSNPDFEDDEVPSAEFKILGIVKRLERDF